MFPTPFTQLPLFLTSYMMTTVHLSTLRKQPGTLTPLQTLFGFHFFSLQVLFPAPDPIPEPRCAVLAPSAPLSCGRSSVFFFYDLDSFEEYWSGVL